MFIPIFRSRIMLVVLLLLVMAAWGPSPCSADSENDARASTSDEVGVANRASAVFAGGCFWCVETDFEKAPGVIDVISGYSGGRSRNPTYENYASGGHREVVFVVYDPTEVTFAGLVEYLIKHIDPTDRSGQFKDKGVQYSPAVYYENEREKAAAEEVLTAINAMKVYRGRTGVALEPRAAFWPAEDYHQDYHRKNPLQYNFFRLTSGRDMFVTQHWGPRAGKLELPGAYPAGKSDSNNEGYVAVQPNPWVEFRKPSPLELRKKLSPTQFKVTQQDGTEPAFRNEYWNNKKEGIYVDVVSAAPLFSSQAKYDSGTGWPSFFEPISPDAVTFHSDRKLFYSRIEVRSRYGDSHLGHVFNDGPPAMGGKRYCMNSAAMRFVPKDQMEEEGYGEFSKLFSTN